jgi:hypothetical protein
MSEPEPWALGAYGASHVDGILVHAAHAVASAARSLIDDWREESDRTASQLRDALIASGRKEAAIVLSGLPKGTGIVTGDSNLDVGCTLSEELIITIDPLDDGERALLGNLRRGREQRSGVRANLAVILGNEVVGVYSIDLFTGDLCRVVFKDPDRRLSVSGDRQGRQITPLATVQPPTLFVDGSLLASRVVLTPNIFVTALDECAPLMRTIDTTGPVRWPSGRVASILRVVAGEAVGFYHAAGDLAEPQHTIPLQYLAKLAGIRAFRVSATDLQEMSLLDLSSMWDSRGVLEDPTLYVAGRYVDQLSEYLPLRLLD